MKQKLLTLTLALMAMLTFSACSSDDEPEEVNYRSTWGIKQRP